MNRPNGSTSAELEDPPATAQPDQVQPQGHEPESTPETEAQQPETTVPDGKDTPPPKAETKPDDQTKAPGAPAEDPVAAAIARLASDGPKAPETKPQATTQPPKGGEVKPTSGDEAEPKTEEGDGDTATQPRDGDTDNPLKDWTPQELKHTKGSVKQRYRELHTKVQELQQLEPAARIGQSWSQLVQSKDLAREIETLDDDQMAWSLRAQGAAVRAVQAINRGLTPSAADLDLLDQLRAGVAEVDKAIGRRAAPADPNSLVEAFTGQIPEDLKEAGELAGLSEKELRLVAALRAHKPAAATPPAAKPQAAGAPTAPRQQPNDRAPEAPARDTATREADAFWSRKTNRAIVDAGVKPEGVAAYFETNLAPILGRTLQRDYPGQDPRVSFSNLGPAERHQLVMDCIAEHKAATRPPDPPPQPQHRAPLRAGGSGTGNPAPPADAVAAAIAHLAIPGT